MNQCDYLLLIRFIFMRHRCAVRGWQSKSIFFTVNLYFGRKMKEIWNKWRIKSYLITTFWILFPITRWKNCHFSQHHRFNRRSQISFWWKCHLTRFYHNPFESLERWIIGIILWFAQWCCCCWRSWWWHKTPSVFIQLDKLHFDFINFSDQMKIYQIEGEIERARAKKCASESNIKHGKFFRTELIRTPFNGKHFL